jgi:hypothetical protein
MESTGIQRLSRSIYPSNSASPGDPLAIARACPDPSNPGIAQAAQETQAEAGMYIEVLDVGRRYKWLHDPLRGFS